MKGRTTDHYSALIHQAFQYRDGDALDTQVYIGEHATYDDGGCYVYEFRGSLVHLQQNLSALRQLHWIDNHTRAVTIQLTVYNPNVQLFTSIILLAEFLITGGVFASARFEPLQFYGKSIR
jgi:hypothetical protein